MRTTALRASARPVRRSRVSGFRPGLSLPALLLLAVAWLSAPAAAGVDADGVVGRLTAGESPDEVAASLPADALDDVAFLNRVRLGLKRAGQPGTAQALLEPLAARAPTDAVLLNLSLAYVDQMQGRNLLNQGRLSTRSQRTVERIIERTPEHWAAWYIRGLNNLYWPDWFRKAPKAREYLTETVAIAERLPEAQRSVSDRYALGCLALGDAHALLDEPEEARRAWQAGLTRYPYVGALRERLALTDAEQHQAVRALRDADKPIDTDLRFLWEPPGAVFTLTLTGGELFGPGPLDDQPLRPGGLYNLRLAAALTGYIPAFNNGADEPNLPGELMQGKTIDGLLSDGAPANEHVDVGFVSLMDGRFNLFLAAVQDGPHQGRVNFFLDRGWHWTIFDDIGIDPGFPVGVVKFRDFTFSTGPRLLPVSRQTQAGAPAGVDRAGSVASGAVVPGRLGDADADGLLDGTFNAIGRFPYDSVILPGAPFAQTRVFTTDIPVTPAQAALLALANGLAYLRLAIDLAADAPERGAALRATYAERLAAARAHAERAAAEKGSDPLSAPSSADPLPAASAKRALAPLLELDAEAGEAELCRAWGLLESAAAAGGLHRRDFDATGIDMNCGQ